MQGTTQGRVHDVFSARLQDLQSQAARQSQAYTGSGQRVWQLPRQFAASGISVFDIAQLHEPDLNRENLNTNYLQAIADPTTPGTVGDIIALKQQIDYMSMEERALRYRLASPCRCLAHAAGRRNGHGQQGIFSAIEAQVAAAIAAGSVPPLVP